jgi:hypothetical protein
VNWAELAGIGLNFGALILGFLRLRSKQNEIHVLVNSKLDAALARGVQLDSALKDAGVDVPDPPA